MIIILQGFLLTGEIIGKKSKKGRIYKSLIESRFISSSTLVISSLLKNNSGMISLSVEIKEIIIIGLFDAIL